MEQDLFLTMGGMAWAFTIQKKRHASTGEEVPVHWNTYTPLLIAKPAKFDFDAVPRGEDKVDVLRQMWEASKEEDEEIVEQSDGTLKHIVRDHHEDSESDHDVLINVRESSTEPSDDGKDG